MPDLYQYRTVGFNPCDVCAAADGSIETEFFLDPAPNPACRNAGNCNCYHVFYSSGDDGCTCYLNCPGEFYSDDCQCPVGCCCIADDWSRYWSVACDCGGSGGGSGGNDCVPSCEDEDGTCNPPYYWCEDLDGEVWCIPDDVCYDIGGTS